MSESMSSPWIRDYLVDVAETYGTQLYNAPVSSGKKKVQLTDFLTYQENSYVWAWISDKDHRVSVRISKDAAGAYKSRQSRNIIDCRFSVVVISSYRPMFSPRPLGPNATGNTPVSHLSLEIDQVKLIGIGGHLFGNPRDLESDANMREWVLGLRQDGGGGNVLKLRKQQDLEQSKKAPPSPPSPPPFSLYVPASQCQATKATEDTTKPKPEKPQDLKRAYAKRWRIVEAPSWKFATKPAAGERHNLYPTPPHRTPSPTSKLQRQGTPTDWSPSNRGSPVVPDKATTHDEAEALPTTLHLPSDTGGHITVDTAITSDTRSLQPPTPAQRIRRSPPPRSTSPPRSSPEIFARPSPLPSQQLPCSSPLPPSSSLPLPSSSLPNPTSMRKDIQRKVPHPEFPVSGPDSTKQGPAQILVPNSDPSGTGSSQSYSQSQHPSQFRQSQRQLLLHSPAFPSSLAKDFEPPDASTPRDAKPGNSTIRTPKMSAESLPTHRDINEQEATSADDKHAIERPETKTRKQEGSDSTRPPAPSIPRIEVLEVRTSDTEEEAEQVPLTCNAARPEVGFDMQNGTQETGKGDADAEHEDNHIAVDKVEVQTVPRGSPPRRPSESCLPAASVIQRPSSSEQHTNGLSVQHPPQSPERTGSQSSMHSLFSAPSQDKRIVSSHVLPVDREEDKVQEKTSPARVPNHDPETWKEPSFLVRSKGKGKARAVEQPDTPGVKVAKKHRRSAQPESPVPKRAKVAVPEVRRVASGGTATEIMQRQDVEAPSNGKMHSSNRPSTSPTDSTETTKPSIAFQTSKPRLANFVVDFERIDLGKRVPIPMVDMEKDIKSILLTTGRIRTLGDVEKDGSVYIMR